MVIFGTEVRKTGVRVRKHRSKSGCAVRETEKGPEISGFYTHFTGEIQ